MPVTFEKPVAEKTTCKFTGILKDENGAVVPGSSLTTLTLTLYNVDDGQIINNRNDQNILNANGGSVDGLGNFTLRLRAADNIILDPSKKSETHRALIRFTYNAGQDAGSVEVEFRVQNLLKV